MGKNTFAAFYDAEKKKVTAYWQDVRDNDDDRLTYSESVIVHFLHMMKDTYDDTLQSVQARENELLKELGRAPRNAASDRTFTWVMNTCVSSIEGALEQYRSDWSNMLWQRDHMLEKQSITSDDYYTLMKALNFILDRAVESNMEIDPLDFAPTHNCLMEFSEETREEICESSLDNLAHWINSMDNIFKELKQKDK